MTIMSTTSPVILSDLYIPKEGYQSALDWFGCLKAKGLNPQALTTDGEKSILRAIRHVWPTAKIQRCLYHIQHEGCRWLRTYPKTCAGKELRRILCGLTKIRSIKERNQFIAAYKNWLKKYQAFILALPSNIKANYDLKRTITLIHNALPNMFHYLMDPLIHHTTNSLEGWHSRIKRAYRQHVGLSQRHKIQYLQWFSYSNIS